MKQFSKAEQIDCETGTQMAMQICVLCDDRIGSIAEWQESIDAEGFSLRLLDADSEHNLSAYLNDEQTSIEYDVHDFSELKDSFRHVNFVHDWRYAVTFTWSSDFAQEIAAWMAATAYAGATNGAIFDEQTGRILTAEESIKIAHDIEQRRPKMEAMLRDYIDQLKAKSPDAEAALESFMRQRSTKPS